MMLDRPEGVEAERFGQVRQAALLPIQLVIRMIVIGMVLHRYQHADLHGCSPYVRRMGSLAAHVPAAGRITLPQTCPVGHRSEHRGAGIEQFASKTSDADGGPRIVMLQDFRVSLALICHDSRADLTEAHTVSPAGSSQDKAAGLFVDDECRAVKMRAR